MTEIKSFHCLQCGACCRDLRIRLGDVTVSLFLLSTERTLFPPELVKPSWMTITGLKKMTWGWQLDADICPYMKDNMCTNYEHRPMSCRGFPVQIIHGQLGIEAFIDVKCPAAKKTRNIINKPAVEIFGEEIIDSANFISRYSRHMLHSSQKTFIYDLQSQTWKEFNSHRAKMMMNSDIKRVIEHDRTS